MFPGKKLFQLSNNQKIELGTDLANSSGDKLQHIVCAVGEVNSTIVSINESTITQQQAIQEVDTVVKRLTMLLQKNSAITEETMASAKQLAHQANKMRRLLNYFTSSSDNHIVTPVTMNHE